MKKQIKKAFALSLLLLAVLWLNTRTVLAEEAYVATVTMADGSSTTGYTSLEEAISTAEANEGAIVKLIDNVKLTNNISTETFVIIDSGTVTIDLNGYCWESSSWALYVEGTANVTITDTSDGKSGVLRGTDDACPTILLQENGALTFSGGTIEHTRGVCVIDISDGGGQKNNATFEMNGGTLKTSDNAIDAYGASVTINDGIIEAEESAIFWKYGTINLRGYSSPDGFVVDRASNATATIDDIILPDGYVLADRNLYKVDVFTDSDDYSVEYIVKKNNTQTVTFDANGGTCTIPSTNTTVEGKLTSLPGATHENLFLKGWYDTAEGGSEITPGALFTEPTTIYAQYSDTYTHYASNIVNGKCVCGKEYIHVELANSYGVGWIDSAITLWKNGELIETMTITEEQKTAATYRLEYDSSANYWFQWKTGTHPMRCSFTIYVAGEEKLVATREDCDTYSDGQMIYILGCVITEQPVADKLTVTTNDENAKYQWYQVEGTAFDTQVDILLTEETVATLANPEIGKSYACLVTFSNGTTEVSDVVYYPPFITTQPTVSNPTVQTNDTEATYQWYEASPVVVDVTMENIYDNGYDWETVYEGWFLGFEEASYYSYFYLELKAGDVVTVSTAGPLQYGVAMLNMMNPSGEFSVFETVDSTGQAFSIEAPEDGIWSILTMESSGIKATVSSFTVDKTKPLANETGATLSELVPGKGCACVVTFRDGTTETSDAVYYPPVIITQPTVSDPTVETNDTGATYQWYEASNNAVDVTMENIYDDGYDWEAVNTEGWFTGDYDEELGCYYFALELRAGDVVTVSTQDSISDPEGEIVIENYDNDDYRFFESVNGSVYKFSIEVPYDGIWYICTRYDNDIKAAVGNVTVDMTKPLDDETGATLQNPVPGKSYACVVTFANNTTETSEVIAYGEATFSGTNITLKDTIDMNFYVNLPEGITDAAVKFTVNGTEKATVDLVAVANGEYQATYQVAAKEMTDEITAELMVGETVAASYTTSVRKYAETILADTENETYTAETQALVKAMLNYGAYAQVYFNYNTSNLANAGYEDTALEVDATMLRSYVPDVAFSKDGEIANYTSDNGITYVGSSMLLESRIMVRHYFDVGENTAHGLTNKTEGGYYYVDTAVNIADMEVDIKVTVDDYEVTYCPLDYITTVLCSKADSEIQAENLQKLMKALYLYYALANTYPN